MKELVLESGAVLRIHAAPFSEAKALYQAIVSEAKNIPFSSKTDMAAFYKDLFCVGFSSPEIEKKLWPCMQRCTYNLSGSGNLKIDETTFEPVAARSDFMKVCIEVAKENVIPFVKNLFALYEQALTETENSRKST